MAKTINELQRKLDAARSAYHEASTKETATALTKRSVEIKKLSDAITALCSEGAVDCPSCKTPPFGLRRGRGVYEVGCLNCVNPESLSDPQDNLRSQGESVDEAVDNWNSGVFYLKPVDAAVTKRRVVSES